jgi:hypothetical protein
MPRRGRRCRRPQAGPPCHAAAARPRATALVGLEGQGNTRGNKGRGGMGAADIQVAAAALRTGAGDHSQCAGAVTAAVLGPDYVTIP